MKLVACRELGFHCAYVAQGRTPGEVDRDFWLHARRKHARQLSRLSAQQKAQLSQLVEDLGESGRFGSVVTYGRSMCAEDSGLSIRRWWR